MATTLEKRESKPVEIRCPGCNVLLGKMNEKYNKVAIAKRDNGIPFLFDIEFSAVAGGIIKLVCHKCKNNGNFIFLGASKEEWDRAVDKAREEGMIIP